MKLLDLTLESPAENLALDEALLDCADAGHFEVLRLWESRQVAVIVGRASRIDVEVDRDYCSAHEIPILRRCSGGAAVMIGPGCLMYSIVINTRAQADLANVDIVHHHVLSRVRDALRAIDLPVELSGISDLTLDERKFSGNSLRIKRHAFLYHGTLLYDAPIEQIERSLRMPPRQPDYRHQRPHDKFLINLPATADAIRQALCAAWDCQDVLRSWPHDETQRLAQNRYRRDEWNRQR